MALDKSTLQSSLYSAFNSMNDIKDDSGNKYMAEKVASAIYAFCKSGDVITVDSGKAVDSGVYVGAGKGKMEIAESDLKSKLQATFEAKYENDPLASHIADDIDSVCGAQNTCGTDTKGTSTIPGSTPKTASGKGKGTFAGAKATIENMLKAAFSKMNTDEMKKGDGNKHLAEEWADAVNSYISGGTVTITLQSPMSGTGSGGVQ